MRMERFFISNKGIAPVRHLWAAQACRAYHKLPAYAIFLPKKKHFLNYFS